MTWVDVVGAGVEACLHHVGKKGRGGERNFWDKHKCIHMPTPSLLPSFPPSSSLLPTSESGRLPRRERKDRGCRRGGGGREGGGEREREGGMPYLFP